MHSYKTLKCKATAEVIEKKSVFKAFVSPVPGEHEALAFIESIRKAQPGASHYTYAYRVGIARVFEKCSDDGEPSGTAGIPILSIMQKENIRDAAVVVSRFFGGILLGAGGLIRAYGAACKAGIDEAGIIEKRPALELAAFMSYAHSTRVRHEAEVLGISPVDAAYAEDVMFVFRVLEDDAECFIRRVIDLTAGGARIERRGLVYL